MKKTEMKYNKKRIMTRKKTKLCLYVKKKVTKCLSKLHFFEI